ncbi:hypothetical protein HK105_204688 [Polyrhizophydium stewartii]|uniref:VWFD domain-containing protein n=1 Tax=Polyrhizophydium stewartii TaxID=2732419 RepID=A0ABR4N883_9FUNG
MRSAAAVASLVALLASAAAAPSANAAFAKFDPSSLVINDAAADNHFGVQLAAAPSGPVRVYFENPAIAFTQCSVEFNQTNWNIPQTVGVTPTTPVFSDYGSCESGKKQPIIVKARACAPYDPYNNYEIEYTTQRSPSCGGVCTSVGDPHLQTFDGLAYTSLTTGTYSLVHTADLDIQAVQSTCGKNAACTTAVSVRYGSSIMVFDVRGPKKALTQYVMTQITPNVDGIVYNRPAVPQDPHVIKLPCGSTISILHICGHGRMDVTIHLSGKYAKVGGMCNRMPGYTNKKLVGSDGKEYELAKSDDFVNTWRIADSESIFFGKYTKSVPEGPKCVECKMPEATCPAKSWPSPTPTPSPTPSYSPLPSYVPPPPKSSEPVYTPTPSHGYGNNSPVPTTTPAETPVPTTTPANTPTPTETPVETPKPTPTETPSHGYGDNKPSETPKPTPTETPVETPSPTPTETPSHGYGDNKPSETPKPTPTETPVETPKPTPTETPSHGYRDNKPSETPKPTPTETPVETPSPTPTETPSHGYGDNKPSETPKPTPTETPVETPKPTPTETPSHGYRDNKPSETPKPTPTETPVETPKPTPTETPSHGYGDNKPSETPKPTPVETPSYGYGNNQPAYSPLPPAPSVFDQEVEAKCREMFDIAGCKDIVPTDFYVKACVADAKTTGTYVFADGTKSAYLAKCHQATEYMSQDASPAVVDKAKTVQDSCGFGNRTCINSCSGHGTCTTYGCSCNAGWTGVDCSTDLSKSVQYDSNSGTYKTGVSAAEVNKQEAAASTDSGEAQPDSGPLLSAATARSQSMIVSALVAVAVAMSVML